MPYRPLRPLLLTIGAFLAAGYGATAAVLTLAPLVGFDATYRMHGAPVSRVYFLTHVAPITGLAAVLLIAIAGSIWRERAWTRAPILLFLGGSVVLTVSSLENWGTALFVQAVIDLALFAWAMWYLHVNADVTDYYASLSPRPVQSTPAPHAGVPAA